MTTNRARNGHEDVDDQPYEYVIVGGGIHSTCLANYLLAEGGYSHQKLRLVDPREQLLNSF